MSKCMLIDATHPEETQVIVINGTRLEELDVETSIKRQLKGNVYLARVVRVEPSLQAAFVDYGGSRHGFLAFNEIHPDYYYQTMFFEQHKVSADMVNMEDVQVDKEECTARQCSVQTDTSDQPDDTDIRQSQVMISREYKIQEVIKRRQIMLVQVVKEERGTKGAALTTYLSLAGRYCVLMPNSVRSGGGISRKITNLTDRRRLKSMLTELDVPYGMAVILRTAGAERGRSEIKRDYEYLERTWNQMRAITTRSCAPTLVYEEANLIKRAIRDLYTRDIDEIVVAGEEGYHLAKDFMKMLTPSHAKKVKRYKDEIPLFYRYKVAAQLDAMHSPAVQLRSGGYIVFNQTEALVAIDVNSGKATRERHIEETALKTNLEAAEEIARQLRLRDLAGLVVIDFIDMEESKHNLTVEKRLKEMVKADRARIQIGRISPFGLLELSRQRLRPSLMETSFQTCPHCNGMGLLRSVESSAMHVLRGIEEEGIRRQSLEIAVTCSATVALYILNYKRQALADIESRYNFHHVLILSDANLIPPTYHIERVREWKVAEDSEIEPTIQDNMIAVVVEEKGGIPCYGGEERDGSIVVVHSPSSVAVDGSQITTYTGDAIEEEIEEGSNITLNTGYDNETNELEASGEDGDNTRRRKRRKHRRSSRKIASCDLIARSSSGTESRNKPVDSIISNGINSENTIVISLDKIEKRRAASPSCEEERQVPPLCKTYKEVEHGYKHYNSHVLNYQGEIKAREDSNSNSENSEEDAVSRENSDININDRQRQHYRQCSLPNTTSGSMVTVMTTGDNNDRDEYYCYPSHSDSILLEGENQIIPETQSITPLSRKERETTSTKINVKTTSTAIDYSVHCPSEDIEAHTKNISHTITLASCPDIKSKEKSDNTSTTTSTTSISSQQPLTSVGGTTTVSSTAAGSLAQQRRTGWWVHGSRMKDN